MRCDASAEESPCRVVCRSFQAPTDQTFWMPGCKGEGSKKKQIGIKKQIRIKKTNRDQKTNLKTKGRKEGRKNERTNERKKERKKKKKEVTFSWKMKGKLPSLDPPTRFYFLAGSPCYLLFFFFPSIIVVYLGSCNLN